MDFHENVSLILAGFFKKLLSFSTACASLYLKIVITYVKMFFLS